MKNAGHTVKTPWVKLYPFIRRLKEEVARPFSGLRKNNDSELMSDHGESLELSLSEAIRELSRIRRLPANDVGTPLIYSFAEQYLRDTRGGITQKSLCECLYALDRPLYDEELFCLSSVMTVAAVSLHAETKDEAYLSGLISPQTVDYEAVFFDFSAVERIFLTEAEGVYADSDRRTKHLYHQRLCMKARRKRKDALALARETVARANKEATHIGAVLPPHRGKFGVLYFYFLGTLTLALTALYMSLVRENALFLALFVVLPIYSFVKELLPPFFIGAGERILPRLNGGAELANTKVLVCVMTLLFGKDKDAAIFDKLEDLYLTNGDENCTFAAFCDLPTADRRTSDGDGALIAYAEGRIKALRQKYGDHFALFIRGRRHSRSENAYIGWERKRGGVLELCRFLRGKTAGIAVFEGDREALLACRYLVTLDADTNLYIGAVRELTATMLHPENRPRIDRRRGIVTSGHGVIQPRMTTALHSVVTPFAELTGGGGGIDIYAGCAADLYQQVFDEGSFCGKGILDIDAYLAVCDGFFPNERILSHDLTEGNLLRSALAGDIVLTDSTPKTALSYYTRAHRWLRGDLQMLPYLGRTVKDATGKRRKNPMSCLSKYKLLDNVLRGATPAAVLLSTVLSLIFGGRTVLLTALFSFLYIFAPLVLALVRTAVGAALGRTARLSRPLFAAVKTALFRFSALAYEGYLFCDAAIRTLYRFLISHRNFLNWTTASEGDRRASGGIDGFFAALWFSPVAGLVLFLLPLPLFRLMGLFYLLFPVAMYALSRERQRGATLTEGDRERLISHAHDAWRYFRDFVGEETNYLPPDNYQLSPVERVAMRTSPTNIGLYLLSALAARDHGFIITTELRTYAEGTLHSLRKMLTWNGHYYNWYDIRTLEVIGEPFISTVDSGNFVTSLVAFCEGLREYISECPPLVDTLYAYEKLRDKADFSALYNEKRHLFHIGYDVANARYSDSFYDTFMSEARTTSYFAVATRAVPREHYFALSRKALTEGGRLGVASWSGTAFEYFMPALLLPTPKNSLLDGGLAYAYRKQRQAAILPPHGKRAVFGISESAYFAFDYEMNYQYRAFGVDALALDPRGGAGQVITPYASFLMAEWAPSRVLANLSALAAFSMTGKYGFYEALDLDPDRVGGGYAVIKSYMAHHLGMTIVAASNAVNGGIFRRRFMESPMMRASEELLSEKLPMTVISLPEKKRPAREELPKRPAETAENELPHYEYGLLTPEMTLISNNKTKIFSSSSGHIILADGGDALCLSDLDRFSVGGGLRVYAVIDGTPFPTVPLGFEPQGFTADFDFSCRDGYSEYASRHRDGRLEYGITLRLSVYPDRELFRLSLHVTGRYRRAYAFLYFEPIMEKKRAYEAHRSFSNLFIESEFFPDEEAPLFMRRPRSDKKQMKYLGIVASAGISSFDTMRDILLPLMPTEEDFADLSRRELSCKTGAVIVPAAAIRTGEMSQGRLSFTLGYGRDAEELLYALNQARGEKQSEGKSRMADIIMLQKDASGLYGNAAPPLERYILRGIAFGGENGRGERTVSRGCLYRHGISGENPIVLAEMSDSEGQKQRLRRLIGLFKYMCIRGVRYDFVVLFNEADGYRRPVRRSIEGMIRRAGCESFLSLSGGIFPISENELDASEREGLRVLADVCFDLSLSPETAASANLHHVPLSDGTAKRLLRGCLQRAEEMSPPSIAPIRAVLGGYFHENGFVIEKPHGSIPWGHIIASENFGTVLTENSLGFTFAGNAGLQKLTPHKGDNMREDGGERLILRIYDRFEREDYRDYDMAATAKYVNFAFGYAEYFGQADGIFYRLRVTVLAEPCGKRTEVYLEGGGTESRSVSVCYTVSPCLGEREEKAAFYRYRKEKNGVAVIRTVAGDMTGLRLACTTPAAVILGETAFRSDGRVTDAREDMAAVCAEALLSGEWNTAFLLTAGMDTLRNGAEASVYTVPKALFSTVSVKTGNPLFDEVVNKWAPYQTLYSRIYGRCGFYQVSGAYGFRDQLQDALSLATSLPEVAKSLILRAASRQYESGAVMHWWHEETKMGIMTRCSDDFLWLIFAVATYAEMTGDEDIFDIELPYLSSPPLSERETERYEPIREGSQREPLLMHLCRAAENGMRRGKNGLPLMGSGDWNDGMNLVGIGGQGESVWLAFFTAMVLRRLASILRRRGCCETAERYEREAEALLEAAEKAYDGAWYRRGYYDDGTPLGSAERNECKLDLMPQAFAAMAANERGQLTPRNGEAMLAVEKHLFDREERLLRLITPPFSTDDQSPGYIKGYVAGIRENGGQYTHGAVFAALGFFAVGDDKTGAEVLLAIHPAVRYEDAETAKKYKIEPYVLAGDVYTNPAHMGRGGWSFYTGSAAWYRRAVIEVLCGFTERGNGFYLRPHLSDAFSRFELTVNKEGTRYHITVTLGEREELFFDGKPLSGASGEHFFSFDGGEHEVTLSVKAQKKKAAQN